MFWLSRTVMHLLNELVTPVLHRSRATIDEVLLAYRLEILLPPNLQSLRPSTKGAQEHMNSSDRFMRIPSRNYQDNGVSWHGQTIRTFLNHHPKDRKGVSLLTSQIASVQIFHGDLPNIINQHRKALPRRKGFQSHPHCRSQVSHTTPWRSTFPAMRTKVPAQLKEVNNSSRVCFQGTSILALIISTNRGIMMSIEHSTSPEKHSSQRPSCWIFGGPT